MWGLVLSGWRKETDNLHHPGKAPVTALFRQPGIFRVNNCIPGGGGGFAGKLLLRKGQRFKDEFPSPPPPGRDLKDKPLVLRGRFTQWQSLHWGLFLYTGSSVRPD